MSFAAGFASGWISCLGATAAVILVGIFVGITGRLPRLRWPRHDGPPDE